MEIDKPNTPLIVTFNGKRGSYKRSGIREKLGWQWIMWKK